MSSAIRLKRAQDFVRIVKARYAELQSLQTFEKMLDVYADIVQQGDRLRVLKGDLTPLREQIIILREWAQRVEAGVGGGGKKMMKAER